MIIGLGPLGSCQRATVQNHACTYRMSFTFHHPFSSMSSTAATPTTASTPFPTTHPQVVTTPATTATTAAATCSTATLAPPRATRAACAAACSTSTSRVHQEAPSSTGSSTSLFEPVQSSTSVFNSLCALGIVGFNARGLLNLHGN